MRTYIEKYLYLTIITLWWFVFLSHLGTLYPNIMEARNFVTAREMITEGNWILTTMDGLPRYEKPPLPTWLTAFSGELFGLENIAALRFPSALITLVLLLLFIYTLSRKLTHNKTYALLTTLIAGTSFYIIFAGRNGTWDIYAHAFMLMGVYYLFQFFQENAKRYVYALVAGLFMGLSFMSKGPVSHYALLLPFLISYGIVYKYQGFKKKWLPLLLMILIIAALSSWWAIYIYVMDAADATRIATKESSIWLGYELKPFITTGAFSHNLEFGLFLLLSVYYILILKLRFLISKRIVLFCCGQLFHWSYYRLFQLKSQDIFCQCSYHLTLRLGFISSI